MVFLIPSLRAVFLNTYQLHSYCVPNMYMLHTPKIELAFIHHTCHKKYSLTNGVQVKFVYIEEPLTHVGIPPFHLSVSLTISEPHQ